MKLPWNTPAELKFRCNICSGLNIDALSAFHREIPNCGKCGSTPRFRGIIRALSLGLFNESLDLKDFPSDKNIRGIGMSEWSGYSETLAEKFNFTNTYYHMDPRLDITSDDWMNYTGMDFVICSEVLEHVLEPVMSLRNLNKILKPGGLLLFSVPFTNAPHTIEHFPDLKTFGICQISGKWVVVGISSSGEYKVYDQHIYFHGGPGSVLEMRLFGRDALVDLLSSAGFKIKLHEEAALDVGYYWAEREERPEAGLNQSYIIEARPV